MNSNFMRFDLDRDSTNKKIYELLKEEIISCNLVPGLSISEKEIFDKSELRFKYQSYFK
jgi:DNA-binding GntR family transcriptional regulator